MKEMLQVLLPKDANDDHQPFAVTNTSTSNLSNPHKKVAKSWIRPQLRFKTTTQQKRRCSSPESFVPGKRSAAAGDDAGTERASKASIPSPKVQSPFSESRKNYLHTEADWLSPNATMDLTQDAQFNEEGRYYPSVFAATAARWPAARSPEALPSTIENSMSHPTSLMPPIPQLTAINNITSPSAVATNTCLVDAHFQLNIKPLPSSFPNRPSSYQAQHCPSSDSTQDCGHVQQPWPTATATLPANQTTQSGHASPGLVHLSKDLLAAAAPHTLATHHLCQSLSSPVRQAGTAGTTSIPPHTSPHLHYHPPTADAVAQGPVSTGTRSTCPHPTFNPPTYPPRKVSIAATSAAPSVTPTDVNVAPSSSTGADGKKIVGTAPCRWPVHGGTAAAAAASDSCGVGSSERFSRPTDVMAASSSPGCSEALASCTLGNVAGTAANGTSGPAPAGLVAGTMKACARVADEQQGAEVQTCMHSRHTGLAMATQRLQAFRQVEGTSIGGQSSGSNAQQYNCHRQPGLQLLDSGLSCREHNTTAQHAQEQQCGAWNEGPGRGTREGRTSVMEAGGLHAAAAVMVNEQNETNLGFWDFGAQVYETFPWQTEAFEYADWCNRNGPAASKLLQAAARCTNFSNFAERWQLLQQHMRRIAGDAATPCQQYAAEPSTSMQPQQQQAQQASTWSAMQPHAQAISSDNQDHQHQQQGNTDGSLLRPSSHRPQHFVTQPKVSPAAVDKVRVFCQEYKGRHGSYSRHFVATTYQVLWRKYSNMAADRRHYYEVIRAGHPCHLYFDLEFMKEANADTDGDVLVGHLVELLRSYLSLQWALELQPQWLVELDSSTPQKFSRHLVLRIPGCAFPNNLVVGQVVGQLLAHHQATQLQVNREDGNGKSSIVDSAVYSKNRHFRLYLSAKGGKSAHLTETRCFFTASSPLPPRTHIFLKSLICNVTPGSQLLVPSWSSNPALTTATLPAIDPSSHRFGAVMDIPHPAASGAGVNGEVGRPIKVSWIYMKEQGLTSEDMQALQAVAVDAVLFVEDVATKRAGELSAQVRSMAYCGKAGTVAYGVIGPGSHYCSNIQRCHQSNHVYFVLDFGTGQYCQKCYDPACSGYRSPWMRLPQQVQQLQNLPQAVLSQVVQAENHTVNQ